MARLTEKSLWILIFVSLATPPVFGAPESSPSGTTIDKKGSEKTLLMSAMQKLLEEENQSRTKLDERLTSSIKDLQNINANQNNGDLLEGSLLRAESKVTDNRNSLAENHLRIEFLNSFISMLEPVGDARAETSKILGELAHKELLASVESGSESKVWLFELYLSIAIRDIMEPSENYADFVKKFMTYSTLLEPHSPVGFMKSKDRKYLSGPEKAPRNPPILK